MPLPRFGLPSLSALVVVLGLGVAGGVSLSHRLPFFGAGETRINQSMVVDRLQSVAKLITTEAMVRDVVTYQNTWMGSTKRSLVIATGKALVGIDLLDPAKLRIELNDRQISIWLPAARLLGVDVTDLKTYDETRGIWNPFHPSDRDTIFLLAREQLAHAADDLAVREHAQQGAERLLAGLFAAEGYTVDVHFAHRAPPGY